VSSVDSSSLSSGSFIPCLWTSGLGPVYLPHHWLGDHFVAVFGGPVDERCSQWVIILYVLSVYWLYLWLFRMKFVCNWLDSIFIICIISSWLFLLNVSFSIYLTDPFEDHAAEFYFYLDDNYFCWQWGKNNIIDIICFWCLFDHRCTVSLNCFYSFFLVTCCTATLHFQIQWSFYFDFSFIGKPLSFSFHFLTILVILVCHWSFFWADSFW
jgi:hypothetical protein